MHPTAHRIVHDIAQCKLLWNRYSPRKSLYDLWEYRFPFWNEFHFEPAFVVAENEEGMLPLWLHPTQQQYLWFGDLGDEMDWQEDTTFWGKDVSCIETLLLAAPRPLCLTGLTKDAAQMASRIGTITPGLNKSVLPLKNMRSGNDFLMTLPKKLRGNLRRDQRRIMALNPVVTTDNNGHFSALLALNKKRFADSPFHSPQICHVFEQLVHTRPTNTYSVTILTTHIGEDVAGVDCLFEWNGTIYPLLTGSDTAKYPGIGNVMHLFDIEFALSRNAITIDFAETEPQTIKEKLFPLIPQYTLKIV